jgi:pyruvyltransferase
VEKASHLQLNSQAIMTNHHALDDFEIIKTKWLDLKLQNLGLYGDRLMWWCNTAPPNFGDWVGPTIFKRRRGVWPKLAPVYKRRNGAPVHFAAGSILGACKIPDVAVVWGTGVMNRDTRFAQPRSIHAVRGPLTAARCRSLGYKCPDIFGDPGLVLQNFFPKTNGSEFSLGIIPHFADKRTADSIFAKYDEVNIIDVTRSVEEVIQEIQKCEVLVSSSLHGIIVSHAFERPCAWIKFGETLTGDGTKFHDYYGSVGLFEQPAAFHVEPGTSVLELEKIARSSPLPDVSDVAAKLLDSCPF